MNCKNEYEQFGPVVVGKSMFKESENVWKSKWEEYPPNPFPIGSAFLWLPFLFIGHLVTYVVNILGIANLSLDGYSILYECSIGIASCFYAFLSSCFLYRIVRLNFSENAAFISVLFLMTASSSINYVVYEPAYSHIGELFTCSVVFYLFLSKPSFSRMKYWYVILCGAAFGLAVIVRWQSIIWGIIPFVLFCRDLLGKNSRSVVLLKGTLFFAVVVVVFLPQSLAWYRIYGKALTIPQGGAFVTFRVVEVLLVLFSNNHGMFFWHPITLLGFVGVIISLPKKHVVNIEQKLVIILGVVVFILMVLLNGMVRDWWAGGAFGMRRMICTYPLIAWGLSAFFTRYNMAEKIPKTILITWLALSICNAVLLGLWIFHLSDPLFPH